MNIITKKKVKRKFIDEVMRGLKCKGLRVVSWDVYSGLVTDDPNQEPLGGYLLVVIRTRHTWERLDIIHKRKNFTSWFVRSFSGHSSRNKKQVNRIRVMFAKEIRNGVLDRCLVSDFLLGSGVGKGTVRQITRIGIITMGHLYRRWNKEGGYITGDYASRYAIAHIDGIGKGKSHIITRLLGEWRENT